MELSDIVPQYLIRIVIYLPTLKYPNTRLNVFQCIKQQESTTVLSKLLLNCEHCGFPIVSGKGELIGSITRRMLAVVLESHHDQSTSCQVHKYIDNI